MENTIRNYRNTVLLNFKEKGEDFSLNVPHYNKWLSIIKFLRKRGFKVGENKNFKQRYSCLSKYHKIGYKKNVVCLLEIGAAFISIEFGNIQNLWDGENNHFWNNPSDERYTNLTYLENLAIKLEIKRLLQFCKKYNHKFIPEDETLKPTEYIIKKLKRNKHIHGNVNCLDDIKASITKDSYDYKINSNDKNNKKIICGDIKYFYDYFTKRLSVGKVWHNINNMWWVIVNDKLYNIASFKLFDFDKNMPKRKPASIEKMNSILKKYERKKDYLRCHKIKIQLENYKVIFESNTC